jgi:hypothetical protein
MIGSRTTPALVLVLLLLFCSFIVIYVNVCECPLRGVFPVECQHSEDKVRNTLVQTKEDFPLRFLQSLHQDLELWPRSVISIMADNGNAYYIKTGPMMDWTKDSGRMIRYTQWAKAVKLQMRLLDLNTTTTSKVFCEALYQWSNEYGQEYLDENIRHINCTTKEEPTEDDHKRAKKDWKHHLELLGKIVQPKGTHLMSF